jgi:hypothetical protein
VLGGLAATALALSTVPALAEGEEVVVEDAGVVVEEPVEPELLAACTNSPDLPRITVEGHSGTVATPAPPFGEESASYVLDLAGQPVGTTANVNVALSWTIPVNDFDLDAASSGSAGESINVQPVDPALEEVFLSGVKHCGVVTATAVNFLAAVVVDTLTLDLTTFVKAPKA